MVPENPLTRDELVARKAHPANVPCGTCRACCKRDRVLLKPDEADRFAHHREGVQLVVDHKPNGECVYLGPKGCTVHANPPDVCRRFDCRVLFLLTPKAKRRERMAQNPTLKQVYDAGKKRLHTLES